MKKSIRITKHNYIYRKGVRVTELQATPLNKAALRNVLSDPEYAQVSAIIARRWVMG